jgi:hypothetical protein
VPSDCDTLHVVFSPSAAVDLRKALALAGRTGGVVAYFDNLTFGPIDPPDATLRAEWAREHLWLDGYHLAKEASRFWKTALGWTGRRVVWTSRRVAVERAGFLEWVRRAGDTAFDVIDLTNVDLAVNMRGESGPGGPAFLAIMPAAQIAASGVFELAVPADARLRKDAERVWARLRRDNAPFRRLIDGELVSAPFDTYDALLLNNAGYRWRKAALVIGHTLAGDCDEALYELSDLVLFGRLRSLIESGVLKARGDPTVVRGLWVRRSRGIG